MPATCPTCRIPIDLIIIIIFGKELCSSSLYNTNSERHSYDAITCLQIPFITELRFSSDLVSCSDLADFIISRNYKWLPPRHILLVPVTDWCSMLTVHSWTVGLHRMLASPDQQQGIPVHVYNQQMWNFIAVYSQQSPSALRARLRHTLYRQPYERKVLCKYVWISQRLFNTGIMLKIEFSN
jgi:hypothetical protein